MSRPPSSASNAPASDRSESSSTRRLRQELSEQPHTAAASSADPHHHQEDSIIRTHDTATGKRDQTRDKDGGSNSNEEDRSSARDSSHPDDAENGDTDDSTLLQRLFDDVGVGPLSLWCHDSSTAQALLCLPPFASACPSTKQQRSNSVATTTNKSILDVHYEEDDEEHRQQQDDPNNNSTAASLKNVLAQCQVQEPLAMLSFFRSESPQPTQDRSNHHDEAPSPPPVERIGAYVIPSFCEYCGAASTRQCGADCRRPQLFFGQHETPPFLINKKKTGTATSVDSSLQDNFQRMEVTSSTVVL